MPARYSTELSKGQGMVEETRALLELWQPGVSVVELKRRARDRGALGRATALRVEDIVGRVFARRYLHGDPPPAQHLRALAEYGVSWRDLTPILFIYTARAHPILADFVTQVYWPRYAAGATTIARQHAIDFIDRAASDGKIAPAWSTTMTLRVARYLTGCLTDFGLTGTDRAGVRPLQTFRLDDLTALFLAHELHFSGTGDSAIVAHPDWQLFGLEYRDVVRVLDRVARRHFIAQFAGDLVRITWTYRTPEEAWRGITAA